MKWMLAPIALVGCWNAERPTSAPANVSTVETGPRIVPSVVIVSDVEWEACGECDGQMLEGGNAPLKFVNLPAVTVGGDLIAVAEERDGWGHVPIPGVRLLGRDGKTVKWLAVPGNGEEAAAAVRAANAELAKQAWSPLEKPVRKVTEHGDDASETALTFGRFQAIYKQRNDGNSWLPPSEIRVLDQTGRAVIERRDTERAWNAPPACNLPSFELVGASATAGVILFTTGLGMGGHDCDGIEQRPSWHVLAFR